MQMFVDIDLIQMEGADAPKHRNFYKNYGFISEEVLYMIQSPNFSHLIRLIFGFLNSIFLPFLHTAVF